MDLSFTAGYEGLRAEVRQFLADHWSPTKDAQAIRVFRLAAVEAGFLYRSIPRKYGGSEQPSDPVAGQLIAEEFARVGAPRGVQGIGTEMLVRGSKRSAARSTTRRIGYTWECDVQFFLKRAVFDRTYLGTPAVHRARVAAFNGWIPEPQQ
jgi:alkylation response protein AidB-like acyl-CoA dehydrogenase